jgi:acyl carrier protein/LPS sulfotransferase NodH
MYNVEAVEERVIEVISELTQDWDVELEGGMNSETTMVGDVGFASIDFIQMVVAIESAFKAKLGFQDLLMQGGKYVDDLNVRQIAEFVTDRLNNGVPAALTGADAPVNPAGKPRLTSVPEGQRVSAEMLATFRRGFPARDLRHDGTPKNERAIFVLSPPRSGSTLLRILLAGNSKLFAPPELHLLPYNTMAERRKALTGERTNHLLEGTARALMQLNGWEADEALAFVARCEQSGMTTKAFYPELQAPLKGERLLVDKTPWYIVDVDILKRIEQDFENPLYIHLLRHPLGMVCSYEESALERLLPTAAQESNFSSRELAELTWLLAQQNTLEIAKHVPAQRWLQLRYEDIVVEPEAAMRRVCSFIGIPYENAMINPYDDMDRMTDGVASASQMSGDLKFHLHNAINPGSAVRWKEFYSEDVLGAQTRELAGALGY